MCTVFIIVIISVCIQLISFMLYRVTEALRLSTQPFPCAESGQKLRKQNQASEGKWLKVELDSWWQVQLWAVSTQIHPENYAIPLRN